MATYTPGSGTSATPAYPFPAPPTAASLGNKGEGALAPPQLSTLQSLWQRGPFGVFSYLSARRQRLGLKNPGPYEQIQKEIKGTFLTNHLFDGARADISLGLSQNFQVTHSLNLGSSVMPPTYSFSTVYIDEKTLLHGTMDSDYNLQGRANYSLTPGLTGKMQLQIGTGMMGSMLQLEGDYQGEDYGVNVKGINPAPDLSTGIYTASYLQAVTANLAVGAERVTQRTASAAESRTSLVGRYVGEGGDWVGTVQVGGGGPGAIQASYWQRLDDKVEAGVELQTMIAPGVREAVATMGAKWEFRASTFRGQVDTTGKVQAVLEEKLAPGFSILFSGDLDHAKGQSKFGVGLQMEA